MPESAPRFSKALPAIFITVLTNVSNIFQGALEAELRSIEYWKQHRAGLARELGEGWGGDFPLSYGLMLT